MECSKCKLEETCVIQSLKDAGCDDTFIETFKKLQQEDRVEELRQMLNCHRNQLVCKMHELQKPIDICDYLLYSLKKCNGERKL
ncbi:MAG: hypothetical protein HUJ56_07230 [Erysipelotrichaceae bacterium]|nr:hypothetical protein [Erysipelotrichaceae bacterium]